MKRKTVLKAIALASASLFASLATAQITRTALPDSRVTGSRPASVFVMPALDTTAVRAAAACPAGQVLSGASCVSLAGAGGGGATLLPYDLPAGPWRNNATYPLQVTTNVAGRTHHWIQVNGRTVAQTISNDGGSADTVTAIIPAGSNFQTSHSAVVTAMANNATWQATGILFSLGESFTTSASSTTTNVYGCYVLPPDYSFNYVYYPNSCPAVGWGWQTLSGFSYGTAGPFTSSGYMYSYGTSYSHYVGAVTNITCSWTRRTSNNWGQTTVTGSGAISAWPAGVACDGTNVAHYHAGTGPFAPPDPCANGGCSYGYMNKKDDVFELFSVKLS